MRDMVPTFIPNPACPPAFDRPRPGSGVYVDGREYFVASIQESSSNPDQCTYWLKSTFSGRGTTVTVTHTKEQG